jgi:protein-tyrosine kinase
MGLIEKAGGSLDAEFDAPSAAPEAEAAVEAVPFDIDFPALAAHGFYAPQDRSSRLSLELRAVKRALLRRTGLRSAGGDRRMIRKGGRQRNLVLVTSTRPGEGKTFCAINLALSLASEDHTDILLVDADTPRPKIRAHFGLADGPGLTDRLADPALPAGSLIRRARQAPLAILPEGAPRPRAGELFASAEAQRFFTMLSMRYAGGLVIIDAPPVLAASEALALARHVDEVVFVVEADATPEAAVGAALDELLEANQNVSLLLNRCLVGEAGSYYGAYENYDRPHDASAAGGGEV